jgi:peptidyl-prolyl cis-trans isomerase A (cyclophilin A)
MVGRKDRRFPREEISPDGTDLHAGSVSSSMGPMTRWTAGLLIAAGLLAGCARNVSPLPPNVPAPAHFQVEFDTSRGPVVIDVTRAQAPAGADRFYNLVRAHYFDGCRFFRVVPGFVVQFGLAADPAQTARWEVPIKDDPPKASNVRGTVTFAATGQPNSRTAQLFINLGNNPNLDAMGFAPIGRVASGMDAVDRIYSGDGEKPDQLLIEAEGNSYLQKEFPRLDYIKAARIRA